MKAVSREILNRLVEGVERSFAAGEYPQARRMLRRFMRRKTTKGARTRIQLLLGKSYLDEGKWKKALEHLHAARKRARESKDFSIVSSVLNYIGDCYVLKGDMSAADRFYNRSLRICKERSISGQILARNISDLAQTAGRQGEYRKALARWEEAVGIYQTLPASREHAFALHNTAMLKSRLGRIDAAILDATKALSVFSGLGRKVALSDCLWLLGVLYAQKGEYRDGFHYMEKALQESGGTDGLELARTYIAYVGMLMEIGVLAEAKRYGEEALAICRRLKWSYGVAVCQVLLARLRLSKGDFIAALHYTREAKRQFSAAGFLIGKARVLICETEARARTFRLGEARKALKEAVSVSRKTDDILLKSDCAVAESLILLAEKRFDQSTAERMQQFCEQLKSGWRHRYLNVKYHLAALMALGGKIKAASNMLRELLDESSSILESLPERYRDSYKNSPLAKKITELVLRLQVEKALEYASIDNVMTVVKVFENSTGMKQPKTVETLGDLTAPCRLVYDSDAMREVMSTAKQVARTGMPVLITGETGVGKEVLARYVHDLSRCKGQFVPLNCAAVPSSLMESELFGYVRGAFTGAAADKKGLFVAADNGTLFLDEVGSMPREMQAKLLRVLEEKSVRPLGATHHVQTKVRLLCATNSDLNDDVARGRFRQDLFYRINAVALNIPPLRQRREDIPVLLAHFLKQANRGVRIEKSAFDALVKYDWPGNVRELKNEVARLLTLAENTIEKHMLKDENLRSQVSVPEGGLQEMERKMIQEVLRKTGYNKQKAAKLLGISRTTLYDKIRRYRIGYTES